MRLFFDDQDFDGQLLRALSYTAYGGADIGECFETASRIKEGDRSSWYEAWTKTAERMKSDAEESLKGGHTSENSVMAKFAPVRRAYPRRGHNMSEGYYRSLTFDAPRRCLHTRGAPYGGRGRMAVLCR